MSDEGAVAVPSPARQPLRALVPPTLDSPCNDSEGSDDDLPKEAFHFSKRQRIGSGSRGLSMSMLSPLAQSAFARSSPAPPGFRPPPIRTMTSLEGPLPEVWADVSAIPTPSAPESGAGALALLPVLAPQTPSARFSSGFRFGGMGMGGHRGGSRLGVPSMSLVAPGLYVGDEASAGVVARLVEGGVTHVLNCTNKPNLALEAQSNGAVEYLRLDLLDNTGDLPRMQAVMRQGVEFIKAAHASGGCVLVHCHRGISRSCTLAMAYLVETQQQPAESVFEAMRAARRIVDPNLAYWCALQEWERAVLPAHLHRPRSSAAMRALSTPSPRPLSRAG